MIPTVHIPFAVLIMKIYHPVLFHSSLVSEIKSVYLMRFFFSRPVSMTLIIISFLMQTVKSLSFTILIQPKQHFIFNWNANVYIGIYENKNKNVKQKENWNVVFIFLILCYTLVKFLNILLFLFYFLTR